MSKLTNEAVSSRLNETLSTSDDIQKMSKLTNEDVSSRLNKTLSTSDDIQKSFFMLVGGPHQRQNDRQHQRQPGRKISPSEWHKKPNREMGFGFGTKHISQEKMSPSEWHKKTRSTTADEFCL